MNFLAKLIKRNDPSIIPPKDHSLSPDKIAKNAVTVVRTLKKAGFNAYIVGGGVRDSLLGKTPKDLDVATDALPEQIKPLFKRCHIIGRRFKLAHVIFHRDLIEVATFRGPQNAESTIKSDEGILLSDNTYTEDLAQDAIRRDFTVNALYYCPIDNIIIDNTKGLRDLKRKTLRIIGNPETRYREDPVRMLRAVRLASKLDFKIEKKTHEMILKCHALLEGIPPARLYEEYGKLFLSGHAEDVFLKLNENALFSHLFGQTAKILTENKSPSAHRLIQQALKNTDARLGEGKSVTPAFLMAIFLWPVFTQAVQKFKAKGNDFFSAQELAASAILKRQTHQLLIPGRLQAMIKEMWFLQARLTHLKPRNIHMVLTHPKFRAAYDLLVLRAEAGEQVKKTADWWTRFQKANENERKNLVEAIKKQFHRPKRRNAKPQSRRQDD